MPDGTVDLSVLWLGGGSEQNLEQQGGLKPGEIPVLPWVKEHMEKLDPTDDPSSYYICNENNQYGGAGGFGAFGKPKQ